MTITSPAYSQRTVPIDEAEATGRDILRVAFTPLYQNATTSGEDTGSYDLDLVGSWLAFGGDDGSIGDGRIVLWASALDTIGSLQSATEMAANAGLLWPTNDIVVPGSSVSLPLFAWSQRFSDDRLQVWIGKLWPQLFFLQQNLVGDHPSGFMSRLISNDMAARYYDLAGLGVFAEYSGKRWHGKGGFVDAQSEAELDFSSLLEGRWAWVLEGGWRAERSTGTTSFSVVVSLVNDTDDVEGETAHSLAFNHDLGGSEHSIFGRYTYRRGGAPLTEAGAELSKPLDRSFFLAWAWHRPFGWSRQELAAALMYGEPIEFTAALGFDIQYGIEIFWKFRLGGWLEITPDLQLVRNRNDDLEIVPGLRLHLFRSFEF